MIDIESCLERIGYRGPTEPTLDTLGGLQKAFLLKVPFENLDIHLGRRISLSSESIYRKIVSRKRGGFCYECNILFFDLLVRLGFRVDYLSARMVKGGSLTPEYDHMVLLVQLKSDYLVDVGNGQSCREPLRINGSNGSASEGYTYRVGSHGQDYALYFQQPEGAWTPRFQFTLTSRDRAEFSDMCHYHQTSPDSIFTKYRLVTMATPEGRITLADRQLSITKGAERQERGINSEDEYLEILNT
ncbi:MAG: arylamine N-acetyltransferase [Deltaproteobacteria bacterium]|nr:arylamine N-acetyltransferase [Deltaproteobacteria bacterium]